MANEQEQDIQIKKSMVKKILKKKTKFEGRSFDKLKIIKESKKAIKG